MSSARRGCRLLLERASRGDQGAVEELLVRLRPPVRRYCRARLGRADGSYHAADITAEDVCTAVLAQLRRGRSPGASLPALVYAIAQRTIQNAPTGEPQPPPAMAVTAVTESPALTGALLNRLPRTYSEVLILRAVVGLPSAECGAALGLTEQEVRIAQHRALVQLRALVGA